MTLKEELWKNFYFMKRDIISFSTYKTNIILMIFSALFGALTYAFLGANATMAAVLATYHMTFTTYLIIGIAFMTYLSQSLTLVQRTINPWTLEEVLVSPTGLLTFIVGSSLWGFIWSTLTIIIYLAVGVLAFGVVLSVNIIGTVVVVALGIGTFIGFSMIGDIHNHHHKPLWECAVSAAAYASAAANHRVLYAAILFPNRRQNNANWRNSGFNCF
jgi:hypothetical protein